MPCCSQHGEDEQERHHELTYQIAEYAIVTAVRNTVKSSKKVIMSSPVLQNTDVDVAR